MLDSRKKMKQMVRGRHPSLEPKGNEMVRGRHPSLEPKGNEMVPTKLGENEGRFGNL